MHRLRLYDFIFFFGLSYIGMAVLKFLDTILHVGLVPESMGANFILGLILIVFYMIVHERLATHKHTTQGEKEHVN